MEKRYKSQLVQNLIDRFNYLGKDKFDLDSELAALTHPVTREAPINEVVEEIESELLSRINYRKAHDGAILQPISVVSDPHLHEEWYENWLSKNNNQEGSYYWKRLEDFLSVELSRKLNPYDAGKIVRSIDEATLKIISKLADAKRVKFSYKGLVLGYVQSGKTANFTALIAKAADAGYKLIIVLAGIHNVLRRQTQIRLDRELTGLEDLDGAENYISLPGPAKMWNRLTTANNDFSLANISRFSTYCQIETPTIAVVKKNVSVLDRFNEYVSQAAFELRKNVPVLIIDDEADQASIDTNANTEETDPSRTNDCIRRLLSQFPRQAYVGYTATPFSNVLVDSRTDHHELHDDLYPRNFIVSLPKPDGYFGTSTLFSEDLSNNFVQTINNDAAILIDEGIMTQHLSEAVDQFLISCAIRNLRGDRMKPMSMLVHISHRITDMHGINELICDYINTTKDRYNSKHNNKLLKKEFVVVWKSCLKNIEAINEGLGLNHYIPVFDQIWDELQNVLEVLSILELNSASDDRLSYKKGEEIKVIAIGGNQLSRGLTLEGLMISYYLRSSKQYDTLLQMGRWFGYRHKYEDLTRIFTTDEIWGFFEHLALVEAELRSEIGRYEDEDITPSEMAVSIQAHKKLQVTAKNKIGAASMRKSSYSGSMSQTIWFNLDQPEILRGNLNLGNTFIKSINESCGFTWIKDSGVHLAKDAISGQEILEQFLLRYHFVDSQHTGGPGIDAAGMYAYISRRLKDRNPELTRWNVAVVSNKKATASDDPIIYGGLKINRIQRSRKFREFGYNIGVITEPKHNTCDLPPDSERTSDQNPLLLLYLVWKDSKAKKYVQDPKLDSRVDLYRAIKSERIDLLGIAIDFPPSRYEPNSYIGQII